VSGRRVCRRGGRLFGGGSGGGGLLSRGGIVVVVVVTTAATVAAARWAGTVHPGTEELANVIVVLFTTHKVAEKALREIEGTPRAPFALVNDLRHSRHAVVRYVDLLVAVGAVIPLHLRERDHPFGVLVPGSAGSFVISGTVVCESTRPVAGVEAAMTANR